MLLCPVSLGELLFYLGTLPCPTIPHSPPLGLQQMDGDVLSVAINICFFGLFNISSCSDACIIGMDANMLKRKCAIFFPLPK